MAKKVVAKGQLVGDKVLVDDLTFASVYTAKGFGELKNKQYFLSLYEAQYLLDKGKLIVLYEDKQVKSQDLLAYGESLESKFVAKCRVYQDLRDRGYPVRTGFKYGTDFRVYPRGSTIDTAHTQYLLHVLREIDKYDVPEISRAVRVAQGVKTKLMLAVVDSEEDITYYELEWIRP